MKGPTKAKIVEKGPSTEKNEEKGAYNGQTEGNIPSKIFLLHKYQKSAKGLRQP
jgi:hypothetical protein